MKNLLSNIALSIEGALAVLDALFHPGSPGDWEWADIQHEVDEWEKWKP